MAEFIISWSVATSNKYTVHVQQLPMMVRPNITYTFFKVDIIPPELEKNVVADSLYSRSYMKLVDVINKSQCCDITHTHSYMLQA